MTSMKGEDLLVGWTNDEQEIEEGMVETASEKHPFTAGSGTAAEGSYDNNNNNYESTKNIRRWGIYRLPKEQGGESDGEYYDEGGNSCAENAQKNGDDDDDDDIFSTKSLDDHRLDSKNAEGMRKCAKHDDSGNDSDNDSDGINQPLNVDHDDDPGTNENESKSTLPQRGIWRRISVLGIKQDDPGDDSNAGLLKNGNSGNDNDFKGVEDYKAENEDDSVNDPPDESMDDILVRRLSNRNISKDNAHKNTPQDSHNHSKNSNDNGTGSDNEKETFEMKNPIEGFGSNALSASSQAEAQEKGNADSTTTNPLTSGISNFFQAIQLRRIKARHEYDPFSLTEEELNILKQDILRRTNDLDSMEQMKISGSKPQPKDNLKKGLKNIQAAVLAPEAFAAYTDRMVEEEDGEDNMGLYRNVPLGGEDDIYDDYQLRQKQMKPMKMEGDDVTWSDVIEAVCDPDAYVIDETMYLEDEDPMGVYRGLPAKCDDDDDSADGAKDIKETKKLRGEIHSLTEKVQKLVKQLHEKHLETQEWKERALELEKELEELKRKD